MSLTFGAVVRDSGGGMVELLVDRDTLNYPSPGDHVTVTVDTIQVIVDQRAYIDCLAHLLDLAGIAYPWYPLRQDVAAFESAAKSRKETPRC